MGIPMGVVENDWRWGAPGDGRESWSRMNEEQSGRRDEQGPDPAGP